MPITKKALRTLDRMHHSRKRKKVNFARLDASDDTLKFDNFQEELARNGGARTAVV